MAAAAADMSVEVEEEQQVTPWDVTASKAIDYDKLIDQFGSQRITPELIEKFERITGAQAHPWIKVPPRSLHVAPP